MSDLSGSANALRADGYKTRLYASFPSETEVWRGEVTAAVSEPTLTLTVTLVSGTAGNVQQDMEAEVFDSGGASKGRVRVAYGGLSGSTLNIEEVSKGRILIEVGDEVAVYESWRLRPKLVAASATFDKDSREAYSNQNAVVKPLSVSGGAWAGFSDWDGGTQVDIPFSGASSVAVDTDSGGTITYAWDFGSGSVQSGSDTSSTATVRYSAGREWGSLTVTDSSNSATQIQHYPICVHPRTGANAPFDLLECSLTGNAEFGWEAQFTLSDSAGLTSIPDGSMVILWAEEYNNGTRVSYGANETGRSHIKFIGYLVSDEPVNIERDGSIYPAVRFRALSPLAMLAQLPGFSQVLERVASPASWIEFKGLTSKQAFIYLLRWGTTFLETHDLVFNFSFTDPDFPAYYLQQNVPERQIREVADGLDCVLSCDRYGRLRVHRHLAIETASIRNSRTTTFTLDDGDYIGLPQMRREHRYEYSQLDASGFSAASTIQTVAALLSVAPGVAPADAPQETQAERKIASSQIDLDERAGWLFARDNHLYDGLPQPRDVELRLRPSLDVFDFREEWVKIDFDSASNARGITFDNTRCTLDRVSVEYDMSVGTKRVTITLQPETIGESGTAQDPEAPETAGEEYPPIDIQLPWLILPQPIEPLPPWLIENQPTDPTHMFVVGVNRNSDDDEAWFGAIDWSTGLVDWVTVGTGITGTYCWSRGDPYSPYRKFISTSDGLWKIEDVRTPTAPVQVATITDIFGGGATTWPAFFEMSNNRRGYICIMAGSNANAPNHIPTSGAYTTDYCATWTQFDIAGGTPTFTETGGMYVRGLAISPYNNPNASGQGWVYAARWALNYPSAGQNRLIVVRSTAWAGGTWSTVAEIPVGANYGNNLYNLHIPYTRSGGVPNKNDSNQLLHFASYLDSLGRYGNFTAGGTINNNFQSTLASDGYQTAYNSLLPFNTLTQNGAYVYMITRYGTERNVVRSVNGGTDFNPADIRPDGALAVGTYANPAYFTSGINGWGTEGTLIHFSPGYDGADRIDPSYASTSSLATGTVTTAYSALGVSPVNGFLRVKRAVDSDWIYIETPAYLQKICYGEFQIIA